MEHYGPISSIESVPVPESLNVKAYDARGKARKVAEREANKLADRTLTTSHKVVPQSSEVARPIANKDSSDISAPTEPSVTLSEPDKVCAALHRWTRFAGLSVDERFAEARSMDYEAREAYLVERCRAAKMELDSASSALDRATAIIQDNLPFFTVHFEEMDARGHRSDLHEKAIGKTEWLKKNLPSISKGTFYAALNRVQARFAEQEQLLLRLERSPDSQEQDPAQGNVSTSGGTRRSKLKLTQRDINRLIEAGRESARVAEIGLKESKTDHDHQALREGFCNIRKIAEATKLDSLMAESAKETEKEVQRGKALHVANRLAELALGWCKQHTEQVRTDGRLRKTAEAAQEFTNLVGGTYDTFRMEEQAEKDNHAWTSEQKIDDQSYISTLGAEMIRLNEENDDLQKRLGELTIGANHLPDETITRELAAEPDSAAASAMLTEYLANVARRLLPPTMFTESSNTKLKLAGRESRIMPGDYLKRKSIGDSEFVLCRCIGVAEFMARRKVSDWTDAGWGKEHVVFNSEESNYRVITEDAARTLVPQAFTTAKQGT